MPITLPDELERAVTDRVTAGQYPTAADVLGAALAALAEKERQALHLAWLRAELDQAEASVAAGRVRPFDRNALRRLADEVLSEPDDNGPPA